MAWEWLSFTWGPTIWIIGAGVGRFHGSYSLLLCRRLRPCTGRWGILTPLALLCSRLCCHVDVTGSTPRSCTWRLTISCRASLEVNNAALCLPSRPLFIRMGRAKGAPLRAYSWLEKVGSTWIWWDARCLPIDSRWHYHQGSFIAWLLWLVLSIGARKGWSKWADGGGLQMFALVAAHQSWQHMGLCYKCVFWDEVYLTSLYVCRWSLSGLPTCQVGKVHVVELRALTTKGQVASLCRPCLLCLR